MKETSFFIALVIVLWGFWGFFSKIGVQKLGYQANFWYALSFTIIIVGYLFFSHQLFPLKQNIVGIGIAVLAGALMAIASLIFYFLLKTQPVGYIVALTALYPIVTIILSFIFLGERLTPQHIIGIIFGTIALFFLNL